jgi:hypothetical protein
MKLSGRVHLVHKRNGRILTERHGENLVVNAGRKLIRDILTSAGADKPSHLSVGTGSTAVALGDTALGSEYGGNREAVTPTAGTSDYELELSCTLDNDSGGTVAVTEVGIFNAATAGTMLARFLCQEFDFENGDDLDVTWVLTLGD